LSNLKRTPIKDRFWPKVDRGGSDECWEWIGSRHPDGYGRIGAGGKHGGTIYAHRASWEIHGNKIPNGLCVLHHCDNPPCVNPAHLFLGTQADNIKDKVAKGRNWLKRCKNGHPFNEANSLWMGVKKRYRTCRICYRVHKREYYQANRAKISRKARAYYLSRRDPSVKPRLIKNVG
jgi:hypothetical protein